MKTAVLYPFFSQQDKRDGHFLLESCGSTKILRFIGMELLKANVIDKVRMVLPECIINHPSILKAPFEFHFAPIPSDNRQQRLTWFPEFWDHLFDGATVCFNMHEMLGWPLKRLYPGCKMISMFTVDPSGEPWPWMFPLIEQSCIYSDIVTVPSAVMAQHLRNIIKRNRPQGLKLLTWPLSFDREILNDHLSHIDLHDPLIDILFVFRCSSSNYTHHREFIKALSLLDPSMARRLRVAFTDPTGYLASNMNELATIRPVSVEIFNDPNNQRGYVELLAKSRIVVAMHDNMHGGMGVREALYAGAYPVLLDAPCYHELLGQCRDWPGWIPNPPTPRGIADAILAAIEFLDNSPATALACLAHTRRRAEEESFQKTWEMTIHSQLEDFLDG